MLWGPSWIACAGVVFEVLLVLGKEGKQVCVELLCEGSEELSEWEGKDCACSCADRTWTGNNNNNLPAGCCIGPSLQGV